MIRNYVLDQKKMLSASSVHPFLPRDASAERGYEIAFVCLSVSLSVCPSV